MPEEQKSIDRTKKESEVSDQERAGSIFELKIAHTVRVQCSFIIFG